MDSAEPQLVATVICPRCGADLPPRLDACPRCAAALQGTTDDHAPIIAEAVPVEPKHDKWLDNKWFILGMLFGAALFLGFPWLWKSRAFSRGGKFVVTVLVLIETVVVFWAFFAVMAWSYRSIRDSL